MKIEQLLRLNESKTLEFKENASVKDKVLATIIAFANTSGGKLVIGIEDQTKRIVGVKSPYFEEERLSSLITDSIFPRLLPTIEVIPYRNTHVIVIDVALSTIRPHSLSQKGPDTSTYVRIGSTNRVADSSLLESMKRSIQSKTFDEEALPHLTADAINLSDACESFKELKKLTKKDMISLGLLSKERDRDVPTVGGILLFGHDRCSHFPDAWIQAGCFAGTNKVTILDSLEIHNPLIHSLAASMQFLRRHVQVGLKIEETHHKEMWQIPQISLREALLNALAHTDYELRGAPIRISVFDDRIEIENPGLIPYGLTMEDITSGVSKIRNRVITRVFRELRLMERWGSGVLRMGEACREAGLEPPYFEEIAGRFRVTFYKQRKYPIYLDGIDETIIALLKDKGPLSTKNIASHVSLTTRSVRPRLVRLMEKGKILEISRSIKDPNKKYMIRDQIDR